MLRHRRHGRAARRAITIVSAALALLPATPLLAGTLKGYLENVEGSTLVIGERVVGLSPSTRVERRGDPTFSAAGLRAGFEVEIEVDGGTAGSGTLMARRLKVLTRRSQPIKVEGFVERIGEDSLRVDGWPVLWPQGLARDRVKLGMDLAGEGELRDDGSVELRVFKLEEREPDADAREFHAEASRSLAGLRSRLRIASDPALQEYVSRVGMRVAPEWLKQTPGAVAFYTVDDDEPNAFALPDGTIVVHSGLLDALANEAQLACVLGHELAHVTHDHAFRHHQRRRRLGIMTTVASAVASGIVAAVTGSGAAADLFGSLNDLGSELMLTAAVNGYGRDLEDDADRIGLGYAFDAGYDPFQSLAVWRTLAERVGDRSRVSNWFFGDHSTHRARIANLTRELNDRYRRSLQPGALARNEDEYQQAVRRHTAMAEDGSLARAAASASACFAVETSPARGADAAERNGVLLMGAVQSCPLPVIKGLVEAGVDANPRPNAQGVTPLGVALISGKWDVAEFLVDRGARLETSQIDALFFERPTDARPLAILERAERKEASR
jgi:Zn-dependent protease with chaperone function